MLSRGEQTLPLTCTFPSKLINALCPEIIFKFHQKCFGCIKELATAGSMLPAPEWDRNDQVDAWRGCVTVWLGWFLSSLFFSHAPTCKSGLVWPIQNRHSGLPASLRWWLPLVSPLWKHKPSGWPMAWLVLTVGTLPSFPWTTWCIVHFQDTLLPLPVLSDSPRAYIQAFTSHTTFSEALSDSQLSPEPAISQSGEASDHYMLWYFSPSDQVWLVPLYFGQKLPWFCHPVGILQYCKKCKILSTQFLPQLV